MRGKRFTEEQIVFALKQAETGVSVAEMYRGIDVFQLEEEIQWPWG